MAPRPLRPAFSLFIALALAAPAGAQRVDGAAADAGAVPGAGAAGSAGSALPGGVAAVPTLTPALASPLGAPTAAAAPAPTPLPASALAAPSAVPAHLIQAAVDLHAGASPAAAAGPGPGVSAPNALKSGGAEGAVAHELVRDFDLAKVPKEKIAKFLKRLFDGGRDEATLPDGWRPVPGTQVNLHDEFAPVPALKPFAAKPAASSGAELRPAASAVEAPAPPKTGVFAGLADKASSLWTGAWSKVKQGFAPQPPPVDLAPRVERMLARARDASDPLETPQGILVRAPRPLSFDALGYRVHFARPDGAAEVPDAPVRVRVERGEGDAGTAALRARFAVFNELIETNFSALELIAQSSAKMNVKTARLVIDKATAMAHLYGKLAGPEKAVDAHASLAGLAISFDQLVKDKGLTDADLLPPEAVALVMPLEHESIHAWINWLHQAALGEVGRTDVAAPANLVVKLGEGESERRTTLVDLSEHPLVAGGRLVSPAFKALVEAMTRAKDQPKGSLILQDHQFWGHFKLGAHSAEVYANFLPPDEGGMIRVRYQEWGTQYDNQTRLYYVASLLNKAGFHVDQKNGYLTAIVDKDHAAQSVDAMTDTFALVIQALHATVGVDFALPMLVKGAKSSEEVGRRIDDWVDVVLAEGTLPFYKNDDQIQMLFGWSDYKNKAEERAKLRAALDKKLAELGLPKLPAGELLGQRAIDRFFNEPVEAALARGELRVGKSGRVEKTPGWDPLAALAREIPADFAGAGRMAEAVSSLDPGILRWTTVGSLGALSVERAERRLAPDQRLTVYALRDAKTGQIGLARAELSSVRGGPAVALAPRALFERLAAQGYPVAPFEPSAAPPGLAHFERRLGAEPEAELSLGRRVVGLAASPGRGRPVLARATYDKAKAAQGGFVFVAPYTTPDDLDAIKGSKAVITTSGGLLSHAAITTREMGIPAVILPHAEWRGGTAAFETADFARARSVAGIAARDALPGQRAALAEGALVRLDPQTGAVEVFSNDASAALLDAAAALERYDADGDGKALAAWLADRNAKPSLYFAQKAALTLEAFEGLLARVLAEPEAAPDLARFAAALPRDKGSLGQWVRSSSDALFAGARRAALDALVERRAAVAEAIGVEAVERAVRQGELRARSLAAVASALGRPKGELVALDAELAALRREAKARMQALLAEDVAELQNHARLFPNATIEVLPRLKAAIAKARRRGVDERTLAAWEARVRALEAARETAMRASAPAVLPLKDVLDVDVTRVGGKAAKLGEISEVVARAGGEVPGGLALTVDAYRRFLQESKIAGRLELIAADGELAPEEKASRARQLILSSPLSEGRGVGAEIVAALRAQGLDRTMLAVRSSAVDEDGAEAAFAGAGDTHLYVTPESLLVHVKDVWASLWNPRALLYRQTKGLATTNLAQAVVIQAMVDSEVSGVAFTQDPVSGDTGRLVVNAAFGLGEGVVSGRVAPDQFVVGKTLGREVLPPMIADKKLAIVRGRDGKGTEERRMPPEWRRRRALTPAKLETLNAVSLALERHFGYALDIEFAFVGSKLYILQARPVTNAAEAEPAPPAAPAKAVAAAKPAAAEAPDARRVMFVCTGNTCRSPMAERLAKAKLAFQGRSDVEVLSRGLSVAEAGAPMSANAQASLKSFGVDADGHAALSFGTADALWADVILTMTRAQADQLLARFPQARGKVFTLGEYSGVGGDVADPYGGDLARYRASAAQIAAGVDSALDRAELAAPAAR